MNRDHPLEYIHQHFKERIDLVEKIYNPENLNLHFDDLIRADPALFEALLSLGQEAWCNVQDNQSWETAYWFYDFFLLVSRAAVRTLGDHTQKDIPEDIIKQLAKLVLELSQMTTVPDHSGDITKRNREALANLYLAFNKSYNIGEFLSTRAKEINNNRVTNITQSAIEWARRIENK